MKNLFKLFRAENLLFIIFIQYAMRFFIIKPILENHNINILFSEFNFGLLVLTTVILAASGYLINNYFDAELDEKAGKNVVIGKSISKKSAMNIYVFMNIVAIAIGFYISYLVGIYKIGFIFVIISGLLWFYSSAYKKMFLIGNLIIALMAAMVPFTIVLFEIPLQYDINKEILLTRGQNLNDIIFWLAGFGGFAFIMTLIREIIKDIEDFDGDMAFNANTLPIILGEKTAKFIVTFLTLITIAAIGIISFKFLTNTSTIIYVILLIILPLIFLIVKNFMAKNSKDFHFLSTFTKLIMIAGVLYSVVAYLNF
ncbi:MAG: geranylgeranylglycerol-phosphate geranylgeranyltransferase [Bacteroidales bacterium]|nr:geranylgeranylglycerol-phosphate geranylgeranyltransferase [Bacteroidales bacterium]